MREVHDPMSCVKDKATGGQEGATHHPGESAGFALDHTQSRSCQNGDHEEACIQRQVLIHDLTEKLPVYTNTILGNLAAQNVRR